MTRPGTAQQPARPVPVVPPMNPALAAALRTVGPPVSAAVLLICMLTFWVTSGGFGTIAQVRITVVDATVAMPATPGITAAYLTIKNTGDTADELVSVRTTSAGRSMLAQNTNTGASGDMHEVQGIVVPAHGSVTLNPFGTDVMLTDTHPLRVGETVTLILTFQKIGDVTVQATVTPPGSE